MSRAFVKEPDGDEVADDLPERKISPHPNYVTPRGQWSVALAGTIAARRSRTTAAARQRGDVHQAGSCPCRKRSALSAATSYAGNLGDSNRQFFGASVLWNVG